MNGENNRFEVEFLKEAFEFIQNLDSKTREKVLENIRISRFQNNPKLLKKVEKDIWEFRTKYMSNQIRLLAFWDVNRNSFIICSHGFIKKTQKLPIKELKKAKRIRREYINKMK